MVTVRYEIIVNDYTRRFSAIYFANLHSFESWMFDQMVEDTRDHMVFPSDTEFSWWFLPEIGRPKNIIHEVSNDKGIIYSDGTFTSGKKHCADFVRKFCAECAMRANGNYQFVEEDDG